MAVVSDATIAQAAQQAGFSGANLTTAVAVALAESGGDASATNKNTNGTTDYGLWQINSIHAESRGAWADPAYNARAAYAIYSRAGGKWTPWYAWRDGKHLKFMTRAAAAVAAIGSLGSGATPTSGDPNAPGATPGATGSNEWAPVGLELFDTVFDGDFWKRVGLWTLGALLLVAGIVVVFVAVGGKKVLGVTPVGRVIKGASKS